MPSKPRSTTQTNGDLREARGLVDFAVSDHINRCQRMLDILTRLERDITDLHRQVDHIPHVDACPVDVQAMTDNTNPEERSRWHWIVLPNGDLLMGVYPMNDFYHQMKARIAMRDTGPFL